MSIVGRRHVGPWLAIAMLLGVWLSCVSSDKQNLSQSQEGPGTPATNAPCFCDSTHPTPAPPFGGPVESVPKEDLRAYIDMLDFVEDSEVGDRQALLVGSYPNSARYGPIARIQPEKGNYLIPNPQLARGSIISRIINEGSEPYPKLDLLPKGITYVWVEVDTLRGGGSSVFIETDSTGAIVAVNRPQHPDRPSLITVDANMHPVFRPVQALARFIWTNEDEEAWSTCGQKCCKSVD